MNKKFVVDSGDSYVFKVEEKLTRLESGIYYPKIDNNGRKHLMKRNDKEEDDSRNSGNQSPSFNTSDPKQQNDTIANGKGFHASDATLAKVREDLDKKINLQKKLKEEAEDRDYEFVDSSFFPLFKYHEGLNNIHNQLKWFLQNKDWYVEHGIDYKRGVLAFSDPGTGKTRYMEFFSNFVVDQYDGIVVRIENTEHLHWFVNMIDVFNRYLQNRTKMIIVEELADLLEHRENRTLLLNLLDNPVFGHNIIFFMTTNFPERIQENIIDRPSRIDILEPIDVDGYTDGFVEAWYQHLFQEKFPQDELEKDWFHNAKGQLNIAYWKELFVYAYMRQISFEKAYEEIEKRRRMVNDNFRTSTMADDDYVL